MTLFASAACLDMSSVKPTDSLVYTEVTDDDDFEVAPEDIEEFARRIGIDLENEPQLLYLAREGLEEKLPSPWKPCLDKTKNAWYYHNSDTRHSQWEHPMNIIYRDKVTQARADLAMNKIQTFNSSTMRPPKSLPPLKKSGGSLAPYNNTAFSSLGKLEDRDPAAGDLRQSAPNSLNNNYQNTFNRQGSIGSIISGSSLNSFKDSEDEETPPIVRPQKKAGLMLTGGGANFLKGSNDGSTTKSKGSASLASKVNRDGVSDSDVGGLDKKPLKSILVNSNSRPRSTNPSENVFELDGFSMNLDEMTDDEKIILSQFESSASLRAKGNVKFKLDENTELKFEMSGDENDADNVEADARINHEDDDKAEETDEDENSMSNKPNNSQQTNLPQWNQRVESGGGGDFHQPSPKPNIQLTDVPGKGIINKEEVYFPEYSETAIELMKKAMHDEMEAELGKFKEQLENEKLTRQEQIEKHLDETLSQLKNEKEHIIKRIRRELDNDKALEIENAKREIESVLQIELTGLKSKFEENLSQKQNELLAEHERKIQDMITEYKLKEKNMTFDVVKKQASVESAKANAEFTKVKEEMREDHKRNLAQMKDYQKTIIDRLKSDFIAEEEKLRQGHNQRKNELISKFEEETEELRNKLFKEKELTLSTIRHDFDEQKADLEKSFAASVQSIKGQGHQNRSSPLSTSDIRYDKATEDELRRMKAKYQELETKYNVMKTELQNLTTKMRSGETPKRDPKKSLKFGKLAPKVVSKSVGRKGSLENSDTTHDSANGSESNTESNASLYPSSKGHLKGAESEETAEDLDDVTSQRERINAALQAMEVLRKEIIEIKNCNLKQEQMRTTQIKTVDAPKKSPSKTTSKLSLSARNPSTKDSHESRSARKKSSSTSVSAISKSARQVSLSPPSHDNDPPKRISRSVSVIPQDFAGPNSEPLPSDFHQKIVHDAKTFIRMQKTRLDDPTPIPDASHLIPKAINNGLLFDEKLLKASTPRRPSSLHLELFSETESSGVSSLRDHRSTESKRLSKDIEEICTSLYSLDQQMKLMWSVVKGKQDSSLSYMTHTSPANYISSSSNISALLPNNVPLLVGNTRSSASLPTSARKPLAPPSTPRNDVGPMVKSYSNLLANCQTSSCQTVLEALRMSGISASRLDNTELLGCLEHELIDLEANRERLAEINSMTPFFPAHDKKAPVKQSSSTNFNSPRSILEKTKDLKEWAKKY